MELVSTKEASRVVHVSENFLRQLAREGRIPFYKLSERTLRFDVQELRAYMRVVAEGEKSPPEAA
jgi:excisionase family DNA binding protein